MIFRVRRRLLLAVLICVVAETSTGAVAQTPFFGQPISGVSFFAAPGADVADEPRARVYIRSPFRPKRVAPPRQAGFCVRTCDGRFFPLPHAGADGKSCQALCPSAETRLLFGSAIDDATTEQGKTYKSLANAFRFQRELVPHCSCNAQASTGLTRISLRDDVTLRTGDIVAEEKGFSIAAVGGERSADGKPKITFRPLAASKAKALALVHAAAR